MPNPINRPGLIESLIDFGVDQSSGGLQVGELIAPTLAIQNLTLNYEPALRAKLLTTVDLAAAGAGLFGALGIQADTHGFWVIACANFSVSALQMWVDFQKPFAGAGTAISWNVVGSSPGEQRQNAAATDFVKFSAFSTTAAGPPAGSLRITGTINGGDFANQPLWVPGNAFLNVQHGTANANFTVGIQIVVPALNPGRFP